MVERIPDAVRGAIKAADRAAAERLSSITVADLLHQAEHVPAEILT